MSFANKLTIIRIALIPVFIALVFSPFPWHMTAAMAVFLVASITDFFDGYIARSTNTVSTLGKFLDPIADKMLCACALITISYMAVYEPAVREEYVQAFSICIAVYTMVILSRELAISGFRTIAADKGVVLAADMYGKVKTASQMLALILLLPASDIAGVSALAGEIVFYIGFGVLSFSMIMTLVSGIRYIVKNKQVFKGDK